MGSVSRGPESVSRGVRRGIGVAIVVFVASLALVACEEADGGASGGNADLILTGGVVWTGDDANPRAEAVALRGARIMAVGSAGEIDAFRGPDTRIVELDGRFVSPGFIDNHTHFNSAGALLLGASLLDVADADGLRARIREAVERMPTGAWITGGDWGAYEAWAMGSAGDQPGEGDEPFSPDRSLIDDLTPDHPVLVNRWDRTAFLANAGALDAAGADCSWEGVECIDGEPTGRLTPNAAARVRQAMPAKPMELRLEEARAALADLAQYGVTTIHDNTPPNMFAVYQALLDEDELTTRIYARPTLDRAEHQAALGLPRNFGSDFIRLGGFKGFVDGIMGNSTAMFYEPFDHTGGFGSWRDMMEPAGNMERLLIEADAQGYWPQVHAIGDHAIDTLLTLFARVEEVNGPREDRRFRVIHAQHLAGPETAARMAELGVIAEVQPYHAIDDMRWMEERIGPDRIRWTYAFRTLDEAGVLLSFGSDWPGTNAAWYTANPLMGMYAAVARQTPEGEPEGGWVPEERIDAETALRAYTVNNAWAEGMEEEKGRIREGYLADLVVLDMNPLEVEVARLQDVQVMLTIVDGRVVFER
ncbi:MAG: amidohydrolase [Gemmatimonadales bacterium]|nr:MAG: amidohydrolase [Gemmatimonadales bacterium]